MDKKIGSYLAGLIEGDGTIFIPKIYKNKKNRINYPYISICFNINDKPLAEKIFNLFNGNLYVNKLNTFVIWKLYKIDLLIKFIHIIGPFFRTNKLYKINSLIDYINTYFNYFLKDNIFLNHYFLDKSDLDKNAWLSGFSDADANFNLTISNLKNNKRKRISISFRLELKKDIKYIFICNKIASFLKVSLYIRERKKKDKIFYSYLIVAHSVKSHIIVCNYFDKYSLFSSKYLNYLDWKVIHLLQKEKKHLSADGLNLCINIKNKFNNKRKFFHWSHLLKFYKN